MQRQEIGARAYPCATIIFVILGSFQRKFTDNFDESEPDANERPYSVEAKEECWGFSHQRLIRKDESLAGKHS